MSDNTNMSKEQLKEELRKLIWNTATSLVHGGRVTQVQFMNYMLGTLFYRFISESMQEAIETLWEVEGYDEMPDEEAVNGKEALVQSCGYFLLPSQLFKNVVKRIKEGKEDETLNETLDKVFKDFENSAMGTQSENDVKGLFANFDVNSAEIGSGVRDRIETLKELVLAIDALQFTVYKESGLDVFGICYEHLIKMYALNSGTKGGEFYTPAEVSRLLAKIAIDEREQLNKVYDPACGSGSLLLQFKNILGDTKVTDGYFGQEINTKTYNLARMNMFLHDVGYEKFSIKNGDTLMEPMHRDIEPFDAIVSNPPYSVPWKGHEKAGMINDDRFSPAGILAPKKFADFAFVMHILASLSESGTAAIVEFPGILYRSGNKAELKIREYLVNENYVDTVIALPQNLFFGTSIATSILVLKKNKKDTKITFINAENEFVHVGNKNQLSEENIEKIYGAYRNKTDEEHFCKVVTIDDVKEKGCNLTVTTYVEKKETREEIDIDELEAELREIVAREEELRRQIAELTGRF